MKGVSDNATNEPGADGFVMYNKCDLTVRWATSFVEPYTPGAGSQENPGIRVIERHEPTAEFITIDPTPYDDDPLGKYLGWDNGDNPTTFTPLSDEEAPGKRVLDMSYVITRVNVPSEPPTEMYDYVGLINSTSVSEIKTSKVYPAGTLLYNGSTDETVDGADGQLSWTITYNFTYRPNGWNKFWRRDTGTWQTPQLVDPLLVTNYDFPTYPAADLNKVFGRTP
jgi:hypothetical protein